MAYKIQKNGLPRGVSDLSGIRFGRLVVIKFEFLHIQPCGLRIAMWKCRCDCGNETISPRASLKDGSIVSCGCYRAEVRKRRKHGACATDNADRQIKHIYFSWKSMKARCDNPKATGYRNYGGRGISYSRTWKDFTGFLQDMKAGYFTGASLERKDVNGHYCKKNCRWATDLEQANNMRLNRVIEHNGIARTLSQWSRLTKIPRATIRTRLTQGWTVREALEFEEAID